MLLTINTDDAKCNKKVMAGRDLKHQLCRNKHGYEANNVRVLSSLSRDIKNNRIKEGLLVYPELPEYTASLTSLPGLTLVTELTRGGAAQLNALYRHDNPMPRMHTHLACSNERDPRKLSSPIAEMHERNEMSLNVSQDWEQK